MGLLPTGSNNLITIKTQAVNVTIKGYDAKAALITSGNDLKRSVVKVMCKTAYDIEVLEKDYSAKDDSSGRIRYGEYYSEPLFFEQQRYEIIIEAKGGHTVEFWHDNYNIRKQITPVGSNTSLLTGIINFGNDIGLSDICITVDNNAYLRITIEVFPTKIDYQEDYKALISDITSEVYNLVFDFLKKTYSLFGVSTNQQSSMVEFFAIIHRIYNDFIKATDLILRNPHHLLQTEHTVEPFYKVRRSDNKTIRWLGTHSEYVIRNDKGYIADKAMTVKKYVTYDTKENRITKYMLERTAQRLLLFKNVYIKLDRDQDEEIIRLIDNMISGIHRRCNSGFMREVNSSLAGTGMSLVFGMAPGYREIYRYYLLLQHGLDVTGSIFELSVKDLALLYEYWCFIKLNSLLKKRYKLLSQDIIKVNGSGLYVSLVKGRKSTVKYINEVTEEVITLSYNPKEIKVPTVSQKPDNVLTLNKKGAVTDYEYVFDAKYRINPSIPGTEYYNSVSKHPGPQVDDINTMHRYRDAIVYSKDASPYERLMFGAYVLFPYNDEQEYKKHRFYESINKVNIGGLPFLPSATDLVTQMLDELITDSPDSAFERATLPKGIEKKLSKVEWDKRDVLIGTLKNKQQLDVCLQHNFYHVPKSRIRDDSLPIHYVAIYQTKAKFGAKAKIEYYGEVTSTSIVKRSEIKEIEKNSNEYYYRFEIKEWKRLSNPIKPQEIGFPIEFTNLFLLQHSSYIPELLLKNEEEYRFYSELKRITNPEIVNEENASAIFSVGDVKIAFLDGKINIVKNGRILTQTDVKRFTKSPNTVFRNIMNTIEATDKEPNQQITGN